MEEIILKTIWFFLPAATANMAPVIFNRLPILNYPVDFGIIFQGKPLLGQNKTWRGFFVGIILATITVYFQRSFYSQTSSLAIIDYSQINILLLGFLFGFGALLGDALKSLFKRRIGVAPGKTWVPFDQIDWVIGANIIVPLYISVEMKYILTSIILLALLHPPINLLGYKLKLKKNKF